MYVRTKNVGTNVLMFQFSRDVFSSTWDESGATGFVTLVPDGNHTVTFWDEDEPWGEIPDSRVTSSFDYRQWPKELGNAVSYLERS